MLTLYALVGVDSCVHGPDLFRKFLCYYRECGVDRIVLDLHSSDGNAERFVLFAEIANLFGAEIRKIAPEPFSVSVQEKYQQLFSKEYSRSEGWKLVVDCDEFVKFPAKDAPAFFRFCDSKRYNVVVGNLLDRFSLDQPFAEISEEHSLDNLFPWSYPLTRQIRRGWDRKLVAYKGDFAMIKGHHGLKEEWGRVANVLESMFLRMTDRVKSQRFRAFLYRTYPYLELPASGIRRWPGRLEVHHMAWDAFLKSKMEARLRDSSSKYSREFRNVLEFIESPDCRRRLKPHLLKKAEVGA